MYYQWVEKGEEPGEFTEEVKSEQLVELKDVTGEYILYVKTVDKDGNENITKSEVFHIAGKITKMGTMIFKYNNAEGEDYTPDTYTKENVYIKIQSLCF